MRIFRSAELPWWIVELCDALNQPAVRLDHGAELSLIAAVNDALAWTRDRRQYVKKHRSAWESMIDDFHATVRRLGGGSHLGGVIKDELDSAISLLTIPQGPDPDAKGRAGMALDELSFRLASEASVMGAWADLVIASQDEVCSASEWAWRRNLFIEVAAHAGRAVDSLSSTLSGILDDRLIDVTSARVRLGQVDAPARGSWPSSDDDAGLTEAQRLEMCQKLIELQPAPTRCVVCVGFDHARLVRATPVTDHLTFYPAAEAKKLALVGELPRQAPVALIPESAADYLPDGDDEVVAVIDLGIWNPATAVEVGTANCQALVALVNAGLQDPAWRPMTGHVLLASGWSASSFARSDRSLPSHWSDPMGDRLESLGVRVGRHLPVTTSTLKGVVEASHGILAAQSDEVDAAGRLLLTVRVIEDALAWGRIGRSWHGYASSLDAAWAEEAVRRNIFRVVSAAVGEFAGDHLEEDSARAELVAFRSAILVDQDDGTFVLNVRRACEDVSALASLYPVGCAPGRQLATLGRHLVDGPSLARHLSELSVQHRRLLRRAVRCRDAAAHGGPLPEQTVESVLTWARIVATSLRNAAMDALLGGESGDDPGDAIRRAYCRIAYSATRRQAKLAGGADLAVLFAPDEA